MQALAHSVSPIDENHLLYGNFIGLQYVFENRLDEAVLARSVAILIDQFPALAGRYNAKQGEVSLAEDTVILQTHTHEGVVNPLRRTFIDEPNRRNILKGRAPLSTFTLTQLKHGSILGVAISHVLTDAAGYHKILAHLGTIYSALKVGKKTPDFSYVTELEVFEFGTRRSKSEMLAALKSRGLAKPIPISGLIGRFIRPMIIKAMDKSLSDNPPIALHFTPNQIGRLKQTVLAESGEDWISTNAALCAHFTSIMAKLSYGDDIKTEMQIGQLLDLRNRYFESEPKSQSHYVGNAILIHIDKAAFPDGLQNTSRGALARYFKQRQAKTDAADVKDRLDLLADCLRHGFTNPELDVKNPIISLNNQSKMPVYDGRFDGQKPTQIYPQDVGDNIMFFPAPDGGIDIYIRDIVNPQGQQKLLTPEWQERIFDF